MPVQGNTAGSHGPIVWGADPAKIRRGNNELAASHPSYPSEQLAEERNQLAKRQVADKEARVAHW